MRNYKLIYRNDDGLRRHDTRQIAAIEFRPSDDDMLSQRNDDTALVLAQPILDALGFTGTDRFNRRMPVAADAVDVGDKLTQREQSWFCRVSQLKTE